MAQPFDDRRLELAGAPVVIGDDVEASSLPVAGSITVSTTGALAYRSGAASVRTQLVWYDRGGKRLSTVGDPTDQMTVSLSPDGSRAAVSVLDPTRSTRDLSLVDLERKGLRTRFTFDPADEMAPVWTHDGREIIFASRRSGRLDLFKKPASGVGAEVQLYSDGQNNLYPTDVSRDGKYLLFFGQRPVEDSERPLAAAVDGRSEATGVPADQRRGVLRHHFARRSLGRVLVLRSWPA
jgi:eukaryotic-like serine/threonine-protein kinase